MAILYGTQSNGETLPVLVDQFGNLLAKGIDGPQGPPGDPGAPGVGELPPDPYEGAFLGWLNNELAWIGTPPIPVPEGRFGPITGWDSAGLLAVEGEIPSQINSGVYVYQCNEDGSIFVEGWDNSRKWSDAAITGITTEPVNDQPITLDNVFNGNLTTGSGMGGGTGNVSPTIWTLPTSVSYASKLEFHINTNSGGCGYYFMGSTTSVASNFDDWVEVATGAGSFTSFGAYNTNGSGNGTIRIQAVRIDGETLLIDQGEYPTAPNLNFRIQSVSGQNLIGTANRTDNFSIGKYLRVPEQNVARWLYDGNLNKAITSTGIDISRLTGN